MSDQEKKEAWEKGLSALERILKYVPADKLVKLADRIDNKSFRSSLQYKMFMKSLDN